MDAPLLGGDLFQELTGRRPRCPIMARSVPVASPSSSPAGSAFLSPAANSAGSNLSGRGPTP